MVKEKKEKKTKKEKKERKSKHKKHEKKHRKEKDQKKEKRKSHYDTEESDEEGNSDNSGSEYARASSHRILSKDDYYREQKKFKVWLYLSENLIFENIKSSDETFSFFERYVKLWNKGKLNEKFYHIEDSFSQDLINKCNQTNHNWNFEANLTSEEMDTLEANGSGFFGPTPTTESSIRSEKGNVYTVTNSIKDEGSFRDKNRKNKARSPFDNTKMKRTTHGNSAEDLNELDLLNRREDKFNADRARRNFITHEAYNYKMDNMDGSNLITDSEIYGHRGSDIFERDKAKLRAEEEERQRILNNYEAEEKAKMNDILRSIGITPGSKIEMKKR